VSLIEVENLLRGVGELGAGRLIDRVGIWHDRAQAVIAAIERDDDELLGRLM
jgi:hypothetical protein